MNNFPAFLAELEGDSLLEEPTHLQRRIEALDFIDAFLVGADGIDATFRHRAEVMRSRLEALNAELYESIRNDIRTGRGAERLLPWIADSSRSLSGELGQGGEGYDGLDELVAGVLQFEEPQTPATELAPEMVFYQPTPARHAFAMISESGLGQEDVLIDLGSGLGHVPLLAAICTRARTIGIELEPAYVACARQVASALTLTNASFLAQDARAADLSAGTVFYLYTPFKGTILRDVLDRLRREAERREIRICTFGPCTPVVALETWLSSGAAPAPDRVAVFRSHQAIGS